MQITSIFAISESELILIVKQKFAMSKNAMVIFCLVVSKCITSGSEILFKKSAKLSKLSKLTKFTKLTKLSKFSKLTKLSKLSKLTKLSKLSKWSNKVMSRLKINTINTYNVIPEKNMFKMFKICFQKR